MLSLLFWSDLQSIFLSFSKSQLLFYFSVLLFHIFLITNFIFIISFYFIVVNVFRLLFLLGSIFSVFCFQINPLEPKKFLSTLIASCDRYVGLFKIASAFPPSLTHELFRSFSSFHLMEGIYSGWHFSFLILSERLSPDKFFFKSFPKNVWEHCL